MTDNKTVLQALALINDCNKYKMDLTTNGEEEDNGSKESKEPDYDEDKEQLEEKQEEEAGETETTNRIF